MEKNRKINQKKGSVVSTPGFFYLELENGIKSQTTTTQHTILTRFDFKDALDKKPNEGLDTSSLEEKEKRDQMPFQSERSSGDPVILLDLTNDLDHTYQGKGSLTVSISKDNEAVIKGGGHYLSSFGKQPFDIHFCSTIPGVIDSSIWINETLRSGESLDDPPKYSEAGALLKLDRKSLERNAGILPVRFGVSWVSEDKACAYLEEELSEWKEEEHFNKIKDESREEWNDVLGETFKPNLEGVPEQEIINFYSSLYRTFIAPTNVTGDNPHWDSDEPTYDSMYCIWLVS